MKTENLRINQLSPAAFQWYCEYLSAMDAKDMERYSNYLAEDCAMQFNNDKPIEGKKAIAEKLAQYWQSFGKVEHDLLNIYGSDDAFMLEALNHYESKNGVIPVRAVALTDRQSDGLVNSVRLYMDVSPVFRQA